MFAPLFGFGDPFRLLDALEREQRGAFRSAPRASLRAPVGVSDEGSHYLFFAEVPGVADKDVELSLDHGVLSVKIARESTAREGYKLVRGERGALRLEHRVELPAAIDEAAVSAELIDGVLTVKLPKAADPAPRKIPIRGASPLS